LAIPKTIETQNISVDRSAVIGPLFTPASVAIVGASGDPQKWGYLAAEKVLANRDLRKIYLINRKAPVILGEQSYSSIADLPEAPELAVLSVPEAFLESTVDELLDLGTRAFVCITAGLGEAGPEGIATEARIVEKIQGAGAVMVGPNCMGVFEGPGQFDCMPWADLNEGDVGFISQSGGLIMEVCMRLQDYGLGFSRAISVGNQADLTASELIQNFIDHDGTKIIAIYCEDLFDGRQLFDQLGQAVSAGKPVVMITPETSPASKRAAKSHTGSLVTDFDCVAAAAKAAGVILVRNTREMAEAVVAMRSPYRSKATDNRIAIVSDTGGPVVITTGAAEKVGLQVPPFSDDLQNRLRKQLSPLATINNPVDMVDNLTVEETVEAIELLIKEPEVDGLIANIHVFNHDTEAQEIAMAHRIADVAEEVNKPLTVICRSINLIGAKTLLQRGVPVYRDGDIAAAAMKMLLDGSPVIRSLSAQETIVEPVPLRGSIYETAIGLLAGSGIEFPKRYVSGDLDSIINAAVSIGYPVVLKDLSKEHKSDTGGVVLNIENETTLHKAYASLKAEELVAVEKHIDTHGLEMILGAKVTERLGPVVMLGFGGIYAEIFNQTVTALAPLTKETAGDMIDELDERGLLGAVRGKPALSRHKLIDALLSLSTIISKHPEVIEIEINPLLLTEHSAIALDAHVVLKGIDDD